MKSSKHILVNPADWPLLCFTLEVEQSHWTVWKEYNMDMFLIFGLHKSPVVFNKYAMPQVCHAGQSHP